MTRATAAGYCDMNTAEFEKEVAAGRLPCPTFIGGAERWSRRSIDESLDRVTGEGVPDWRSKAKLYGHEA